MKKMGKDIKYRAFIEPEKLEGLEGLNREINQWVELPKEISHRFKKVLRLNTGDKVELFNGQGLVLNGELDLENSRIKILNIKKDKRNKYNLILIQAWVSADKCEQVVQRATEIGVDQVVFIKTERSQEKFKIASEKISKKLERLTKIAQDASRQSCRVYVPDILGVLSLEEALNFCDKLESQQFVGELGAKLNLSSLLGSALPTNRASRDLSAIRNESSYAVWVGPEGGFSEAELYTLKKSGVMGVTWAPHVLRCETAGLVALSQLQGFLCTKQI